MYSSKDTPFWSREWIIAFIAWYEAIAWPCLHGLAIISAGTAVVGFAGQFDDPNLVVYLRCGAIGLALYLITLCFWSATWSLPIMETRYAILTFVASTVIFFPMIWVVSSLGSLGTTSSDVSRSLVQKSFVNALDNTGQDFARYATEPAVLVSGLEDLAQQAFGFEVAEIAGNGPTGIPGVGSVSNSFGDSGRVYQAAAATLTEVLQQAETHLDAMSDALAKLRAVQIDADLRAPEKGAELKVLSRQVIGEMRALLSLDPARTIRGIATSIEAGVPARSTTNAQSRARIADINAGMRAYAAKLRAEADRIAALAPEIPEQRSLSPAEQLIETMWRMPGLTMVALLMDAAGFLVIFYRHAMYLALKAKDRENAKRRKPQYITVDDLEKIEFFAHRADEAYGKLTGPKNDRGLPKPDEDDADEGGQDK